MLIASPEVRSAILVYLGIILWILLQKKDWVFSKDRTQFIPFGIGGDQSILSFPVLALVIAILVYYLVSLARVKLV